MVVEGVKLPKPKNKWDEIDIKQSLNAKAVNAPWVMLLAQKNSREYGILLK